MKRQSGITLLETILVITIFAIVAGSTAPFAANSLQRYQLATTTNVIKSFFSKAQAYAMGGRNNDSWGVCQIGGSVRLYSGSCLSPSFSEEYSIPGSILVSGLVNATFSNIRGEPSQSVSVIISSGIMAKTITVNELGMIQGG